MSGDSTNVQRAPVRALAILALCGLLLHGAILAQNFGANPLSRVLFVDAEVYWEWAGAVSRGRLVGDAPFFGAPLYAYLLGLLRALGGGLLAAYVVQLVLHVGTALLIARVGTRLFGTRGGVLAGALWLLSAGPAYANLQQPIALPNATQELVRRFSRQSARTDRRTEGP